MFLHVHRVAAVSVTWDEGGDLSIVECIQKRGPYACLDDISQTRLPYLIHSLSAYPWENRARPHYDISFAFSAMTLLMVYAFARAAYGNAIATLAAALYATSIPLLTAGRMLLSHGSVIFVFFTTASLIAMLLFARGGSRAWIALSAIASGAAAASSPLALFNGLALVATYVAARRFAWRDLAFFPLAAATFFATSVIYVRPENFVALARACTIPNVFPYWNYLDTGSNHAPWWYPPLLLAVKSGPWWLLLGAACAFRARLDRFLLAFLAAFGVNLLLKGAVFGYETPHHQVQWYPLLLVTIAVAIVRAWSRVTMVAVAACFVIQIADVVRFFPHYLFDGSQYGERFIGEFYGPAVLHGQGKEPITRALDHILINEPDALILVADHNLLERDREPRVVPFSKRDPGATYKYALVDRLYGTHYRHFKERDAYNALLAREYEPHYTQYFPPKVWVFRIMRRRY
ncbi:MAG TPA: hypothetical protein VEU30_01385 [Thermoanaerobaculia bacterium]|nr:hypothetical protein [Thermoanaerobaculia bacterium]